MEVIEDDDLNQNMVDFFQTTKNIVAADVHEYKDLQLLCNLSSSDYMIKLEWIFSHEQLQAVPFSSNLHVLLNHGNRAIHPKIVFAALNCIRKHFDQQLVVVDPDDTEIGKARVYLAKK